MVEVHPVPQISVSGSVDASRSSSESITQPELPVLKTVTASSPFHITTGKLSLGLELEGPGQHEVMFRHSPKDTTNGHTVDVGKMLPGETLQIDMGKAKDQLVLTLRYGSNTSLQVVL
jgi:hypothetical protein